MKKCITPNCNFFEENGICTEICKRNGIKRNFTYGDCIRSMNDEELAEWAGKIFDDIGKYEDVKSYTKSILEKLKSEVAN